jgi:hypothetical protein
LGRKKVGAAKQGNRRRLRGADFYMNWAKGAWSELRLREAVDRTGKFFALPYGPSGAAPDHDPREAERYFLRLEEAGLGKLKRPDLLIFQASQKPEIEELVYEIAGTQSKAVPSAGFENAIESLPFVREDDVRMRALLVKSLLAVECENSLWVAKKMPAYGKQMKPMRRLGWKDGMTTKDVLPTLIIKEEDRGPLTSWQSQHEIPIHIWHVFYDLAFGIALDKAERLITEGFITPTKQTFPSSGGQAKIIYKIYYQHAYELGAAHTQPELFAHSIPEENGRILPYVRFEGGSLTLSEQALRVLEEAASRKNL